MAYLTQNSDYVDALNPTADPAGFRESSVQTAVWTRIKSDVDALVLGALNENYRKFKSQVKGFILTRCAVGGETKFNLPTVMQKGTAVKTWVNLCGVYRDRFKTDPVVSSVTDTGTKITLTTALAAGDMAVCDLTHDFTNPPQLLKTLAVTLGCCELVFRIPSLAFDISLKQMYANARQEVTMKLHDISRGGRGNIDEWDDLSDSIVPENATAWQDGPGIIIPTGFY